MMCLGQEYVLYSSFHEFLSVGLKNTMFAISQIGNPRAATCRCPNKQSLGGGLPGGDSVSKHCSNSWGLTVEDLDSIVLHVFLKKTSLYSSLGFPGGSVKNLPAVQETWVWSLGPEDSLEKAMTTHSGILARRMSRTEASGHGVAKSRTWLSDPQFHFSLSFSSLLWVGPRFPCCYCNWAIHG